MKNVSMKKALSLALAAAMLLTTLVGCGKKEEPKPAESASKPAESSSEKTPDPEPVEPAKPKVLNITYTGDITTLDPSLCYSNKTSEVLSNCTASLFKHDAEGKIINEMVKDYEVSDDALTYTFHLRDDFKWTNGDPVTANDFVFAMRRIADPATGSTYNDTVVKAKLLNSEDVIKGDKPTSDLGVKAVNDYTLELKLFQPCPYMLTYLCEASFLPINQKYCESQGDKFGTDSQHQVWSGAYTVTDWQTEYEVDMEKNPGYPMADSVKIDKIVLKIIKDINTAVNLFETGELDYVELTGEQAVQYKDDPRVVTLPSTVMSFLVLNQLRNPILANTNARRAICHVFDKNFIVDEIQANGATIADYIIPRGLDYDENGKDFRDTTNIPPQYDIELGQECWEKAKEELKLDDYEIKLMIGDSAKSKRKAEFFQSQLEKNLPGLTVSFEYATSKNGIQKEIDGDFDCTFSSWTVDYIDLSFFIDMFSSSCPYNTGRFHNEEYDALLEKANTVDVNNKKARWDDLRRAEEILCVEECGVLPNYQDAKMYLVSDRVKNFHNTAVKPEHSFAIMDVVDE